MEKISLEYPQHVPAVSNEYTHGGPPKEKGLENVKGKFKDELNVVNITTQMIESLLYFFDKISYV